MNLKTAKHMTVVCMVLSVVCALVALLGYSEASTARAYLTMAAFLFMVISLVVLYGFCRCPWCGKRLSSGVLRMKVCPHCNRDLETGLRARNRKKH